MLRRNLFLFALTLVMVLPLVGCKTVALHKEYAESEAALEQRAKAHAHYAAGVLHDLNDEPVLALKEYYQAVMLDPSDEQLVLEVTRRFLLDKQPDKALELLSRAVKRSDASGELYARLAMVYSQLNRADLAINASRTAILKQPQLLAGYQNLFASYLQNHQPAKALEALDEAAQVPDTDTDFLAGLAELYMNFVMQSPSQRTNANAKAREVLIRAQDLHPADTEMQLRLADDFGLLGDAEHAAEMYQVLLKDLPDESDMREMIRTKLADIYLREQKHHRALEQLESIIKDDPANARIYYFLGNLAFEQNEMTNAADYFSKAVLLRPEIEPAYYDLASAQINLNQPAAALATLAQARARFSENFRLEYLSGVACGQQTNYSEALRYYTTAEIIGAAKDPQLLTGPFYFQIGAACERLGKITEAEDYLEKSLALQPDPETMNYLGFMLAENGIKLEHARELVTKALKAEPKNAAYLDSMGWVLFKLGEPKQALDYVQKAIAASEEPDAELEDHLGDIFAALKQMGQARDAWRKSVELEPNERVEKKLAPDNQK